MPVADCAVTLADHAGFAGEAMAMGERTPLAAIDAPASGRMAVAEAITNLLAAPFELTRVKLQCQLDGCLRRGRRDAALYETVKTVGMEICPQLGISIPVGKDSLSMRTPVAGRWRDRKVTSPVSLIISAFATLPDVRGTLTPSSMPSRTAPWCWSTSARAATAWAARSWLQVLDQAGGHVPTSTTRGTWSSWSMRSTRCAPTARSWPITTAATVACWRAAAEMAFAGHVGVALNVDLLVTEGDGISDSRMDSGDARTGRPRWPSAATSSRSGAVQRGARRPAAVRTAERDAVMAVLREHGLSKFSHYVGKTRLLSSEIDAGRASCRSGAMPGRLQRQPVKTSTQVWDSVSWKINQQRDNPACADSEACRRRCARTIPACMCR